MYTMCSSPRRSNIGISTAAAFDLLASASRGGGVTVESLRRISLDLINERGVGLTHRYR